MASPDDASRDDAAGGWTTWFRTQMTWSDAWAEAREDWREAKRFIRLKLDSRWALE